MINSAKDTDLEKFGGNGPCWSARHQITHRVIVVAAAAARSGCACSTGRRALPPSRNYHCCCRPIPHGWRSRCVGIFPPLPDHSSTNNFHSEMRALAHSPTLARHHPHQNTSASHRHHAYCASRTHTHPRPQRMCALPFPPSHSRARARSPALCHHVGQPTTPIVLPLTLSSTHPQIPLAPHTRARFVPGARHHCPRQHTLSHHVYCVYVQHTLSPTRVSPCPTTAKLELNHPKLHGDIQASSLGSRNDSGCHMY